MNVTQLVTQYRSGEQTPEAVVEQVYDRIETDETNAWISTRDKTRVLTEATELGDPNEYPLYGVPFAVKDNIDYAGLTTTVGCPAYAYDPAETATVVESLIDAGALLIGKTNLDQFASGLVGTRTPYGRCRNVYNSEYISGGSSSGSAVAVARGHVAFALGTDTAGSGRVPAAFNSLIGLKPSRGLVSTDGVVPACESLDCVSIFTHSCRDALLVAQSAAGYDPSDPYSRSDRTLEAQTDTRALDDGSITIGVPDGDSLEFFGDEEAATLYHDAVETIGETVGNVVPIEFDVFTETAALLYGGPWVAERVAAIESFVKSQPEDIHPVVREILTGGLEYSAVETFTSFHTLERLKRQREQLVAETGVDVVITPTTGTVYTVSEVLEKPIERNSHLGYYTDYVNLLDLSAIAVPAGQFDAGPGFGLTILGEAGEDRLLAAVGQEIHTALNG